MQSSIGHDNRGTIRSMAAMNGLLLAEIGDGMVQFNVGCEGSSFTDGPRILDCAITPGGGSRFESQRAGNEVSNLARHGTLITENASPERTAEELQRLLGNSSAKLKAGGTLLPPPGGSLHEDIQIEQAKARARVEVDVILENNVLVQGADVRGHAVVNVRKPTKNEGPLLLSGGKIRVVGYECISGTKVTHSFYQWSRPISCNESYFDSCHRNGEISEYLRIQEGTHEFPFCMRLALSDEKGCPKGVVHDLPGAAVRYITIVSFKIKDTKSEKRSVAHFYRACEVWPRLDLTNFLSPAARPLRATASKSLFMGGEGRLILTAGLIRLYWVSGQQCFVQLDVQNETKKTVTCVTLTLLRNTVIFRPQPQLDTSPFGPAGHDRDPDACRTATTTKVVAESTLVPGETAARGHASAKGWWIGVPPRTNRNFCHSIIIPAGEVSIPRSKLLEVEYILKVTLSAGTLLSTDVQVSLPIRVISFLSLDPHINHVLEPTLKKSSHLGSLRHSRSASSDSRTSVLGYNGNGKESLLGTGLQSNGMDELELGDLPTNHVPEPRSIPLRGLCHSRSANSGSNTSLSKQNKELFIDDGLQANETEELEFESDNDSEVIDAVLLNDSTPDVTEEALNHAVAHARIDQIYGERAPRFADLYHASLPENHEIIGQTGNTQELLPSKHHIGRQFSSSEEQSGLDSYGTSGITGTMKEGRFSRQATSSFAHRVEEKLRATCKTNPVTPLVASGVRHSRKPSLDDILLVLSATSRAADDMFHSRPIGEDMMETADPVGSEYVKIGERDICGKPGLVKSKIQELEQRFNKA